MKYKLHIGYNYEECLCFTAYHILVKNEYIYNRIGTAMKHFIEQLVGASNGLHQQVTTTFAQGQK